MYRTRLKGRAQVWCSFPVVLVLHMEFTQPGARLLASPIHMTTAYGWNCPSYRCGADVLDDAGEDGRPAGDDGHVGRHHGRVDPRLLCSSSAIYAQVSVVLVVVLLGRGQHMMSKEGGGDDTKADKVSLQKRDQLYGLHMWNVP